MSINFTLGCRAAACPKVRISVVGSGTGEVFEEMKDNLDKLEVAFTPSKGLPVLMFGPCLKSELYK